MDTFKVLFNKFKYVFRDSMRPLITHEPSIVATAHFYYPSKITKNKEPHSWVIDRRTLIAKKYNVHGINNEYSLKVSPNRYVYEADLIRYFEISKKSNQFFSNKNKIYFS
jgi:hypothetical protein